MKTLTLEIDDSIYSQVVGFLNLLPEKQCHIVETLPLSSNDDKELTIKSAFGLIKTPITATLADIEQGIIEGAISDSD
ncbi:hypothetical protein [Methylobacter sp.]|uniref:hypothetical protein n=1 Tax=Methylobacter sp. TaxID=2051955 RepID=UPI002FDD26C0